MALMTRPRPSSIPRLENGDPNPEWNITEDGVEFHKGDKVFDYYDCRWVTVKEEPSDTYDGWFDVEEGGSLNSCRVSNKPPAWWKGDK